MSYLTEFVNWVNTINEVEFLAESKGHMDHPEDMVILGALPGYKNVDQVLATMDAAARNPQNITIKFDGYPALIFGTGPDGKFTILDKHMFNRADRPKIHSPQQFAQYEAQRGEKGRSGLVELVAKIWPGLQKNYQGQGYYMGDLLFHDVLKDQDGVYKFRPNPNGILYQVQTDSNLGKLLNNKVAGIAVHRYLSPEAQNTEDQVTWLSNLGNLQNNSNVALLPVSMPITPEIKLNKQLKSKAESAKSSQQEIYKFITSSPQNANAFANLFTVYLNSRIVSGNLQNLTNGFMVWVKKRLDDQLAKKSISPRMHTALLNYINVNSATIKKLFQNWIDIYNYKMDIVRQIDRSATQSPIKGYLQSGQESQEGFVYGGLKFIDRQGFSAQNLASRTNVAEAKTGKKLVVIYPGGFHPFHLGHRSVYNNLIKNFPGADVYVAATDTTSERPFQFDDKQRLAQASGVPADKFIQVKSPYRANEITSQYDPATTSLVFAVSEKDQDRFNFAPKKDRSPAYFQPYDPANLQSLNKHGYIYITPKIDFSVAGKKIDSASTIRKMYAQADDQGRMRIAQDLYPDAPDIKAVKDILDKYLADTVTEADNPDYFGGSSQSAIPGTPDDLRPRPDAEEMAQYHKEIQQLKRWMGH